MRAWFNENTGVGLKPMFKGVNRVLQVCEQESTQVAQAKFKTTGNL